MNATRSIAAVVIVASCLLSLTACKSSSQKCANGVCDVSLKGDGADTTLGSGDNGSAVKLISASGGKAVFTMEGKQLECTQGQTVNYGTTKITCTTVGDSELKLHIII